MNDEMVTLEIPREQAVAMLEAAISDFSEECNCAGWMSGIEHDLWQILESGEDTWGYGMCGGAPDSALLKEIRLLRDATGMWFCGYREACSVEEYRFMRGEVQS